jgi:flagellar biosynthesis GTPase FlhF
MKIRPFTGTDMRGAMDADSDDSADTGVTTLLAVPASAASSAMQEIVDAFRTAQPAGCILTRTDAATSLGGALSELILGGLSLARNFSEVANHAYA